MAATKLHQLAEYGQSIWLDYISREMLETGQLQEWIARGLRGQTSNPSIFHQAISSGNSYDDEISKLKAEGKSAFEIYDALTVRDIRAAADQFQPVFSETRGFDGYVSLEINPELAHDTDASIAEGRRLYETVHRPNLMVKVPATPEGLPVIEQLTADGIDVNATLIFSLEQYEQTCLAYLKGLERRAGAGGDLSPVRSVASVFVSRTDSAVDRVLDERLQAVGSPAGDLESLRGRAAVAYCRMILARAEELMAGERFAALKEKGASWQRVLWGSTSTKNPAYSDVKYVEELIAAPTVNTVPEKTLRAFMDHGAAIPAKLPSTDDARRVLDRLNQAGIDIDLICRGLLDKGVEAFVQAFSSLLSSIEKKAGDLVRK